MHTAVSVELIKEDQQTVVSENFAALRTLTPNN